MTPFFMLRGMFGIKHIRTHLRLMRDFRSFLRIHFLSAALESGILQALDHPRSPDDLASRLGIQRRQLLETFLDLGVAVGDLRKVGPHYQLKSRDSRVLARGDGDALAALVQEYAAYHADVFQSLTAVLKGGPLGEYLEHYGTLIARSSRTLEPLIGNFVKQAVASHRPHHLLEVGCGSGIYLKYAHAAFPDLEGIAIDLNQEVVERARQNLEQWGIADRFQVLCADIRQLPAQAKRTYDWISLYQNVYYFEPEERPRLYQLLGSLLEPNGVLAIISLMHGHTLSTLNFDLVLQSTSGCAPLPVLEQVIHDLRASGFDRVEHIRLMPGEPLYAVLGYKK